MNRNHKATATRGHSDKSNGGDRVVRTLRVYESGRVAPVPGRPPRNWGLILARASAHALPTDGPATAPAEIRQEAPAARVKNPAKVAAGKARAAKAAAAKLAAQGAPGAIIDATAQAGAKKTKAKPARKAPAKAASKPKAKPAAKAKAPAKRGGARAGSGPKPKAGDAMVVVAFRVTPAQKKKLDKLGNGEFIRDRIDRAAIPAK